MQDTYPLAERIAEAHNRFECIHPFIDGNGRTGRIVLNMVLVRLGYPPVIILKQQRPAYLAAMEQADRAEFGALAELLARAMID
ncbi:Fic family protein, partial [Escherichia coli]|uniref:Fic family protein n=1 Tax=Escherichia coli TaxID=562 RepID=UPI0011C9C9D2